MPTVPLKKDIVQDRPMANIRVSPSAGGAFGVENAGQIGKGIRQVADVGLQIYQEEKKKVDKAVGRSAYSEMTAFRNEFLANAMTRKGQDSFGLPEEFNKSWNKRKDDISKKFTNNQQKESFAQMEMSMLAETDSQIQKHMARERFSYDSNESKAAVTNEMQYAVNNFYDPVVVAEKKQVIKAIIDDFATDNGLGPEARKLTEREAMNNFHSAIIENMIVADSNKALEYYEINKDDIDDAVLNKADINAKIVKFQRDNIRKLEEDVNDRILNETLDMNELLSLAKPVEQGGLGSKRVNSYISKVKTIQNKKIKEIVSEDKRAKGYVELFDKFISKDIDNFKFKELIIDAMADGTINDDERKDLKDLSDKVELLGKNPNFIKNPIKSFNRFFGDTREFDAEKSTALKVLVNRIGKGENPSEATKDLVSQEILKKFPELIYSKDGFITVLDKNGNKAKIYADGTVEEIK